MKAKRSFISVILVLSFSWLMVPVLSLSGQELTPTQKSLLDIMKMKEAMKPDMAKMESLARQITKDNDQLANDFRSQNFAGMAQLCEDRGILVMTPKFQRTYGKNTLEFWKSVWQKETELTFVTTAILLSDVVGKGIEGLGYDTVATVTHEFHVVKKAGGTVAHNATGAMSIVYRHRTGCPWE